MKRKRYRKKAPIQERPLKRAFDIIVAVLGLLVLSPMILLIAILIKLEGVLSPKSAGPVIHGEIRMSRGLPFILYKFRTVKAPLLEAVRKRPNTMSQSVLQKMPRALTRTGGFLVKYYLDELPQLFNILRGDMSFVGPRPKPPTYYRKIINQGFRSREVIRAGLCGLTQACKRNMRLRRALFFDAKNIVPQDVSKVLYLDRIYFEKYKRYPPLKLLSYDIKIMLMTLRVNIKGEGA